jgi:hypothetical protein
MKTAQQLNEYSKKNYLLRLSVTRGKVYEAMESAAREGKYTANIKIDWDTHKDIQTDLNILGYKAVFHLYDSRLEINW